MFAVSVCQSVCHAAEMGDGACHVHGVIDTALAFGLLLKFVYVSVLQCQCQC